MCSPAIVRPCPPVATAAVAEWQCLEANLSLSALNLDSYIWNGTAGNVDACLDHCCATMCFPESSIAAVHRPIHAFLRNGNAAKYSETLPYCCGFSEADRARCEHYNAVALALCPCAALISDNGCQYRRNSPQKNNLQRHFLSIEQNWLTLCQRNLWSGKVCQLDAVCVDHQLQVR